MPVPPLAILAPGAAAARGPGALTRRRMDIGPFRLSPWSMGFRRESRSLPSVEAGGRNTGRGFQGARNALWSRVQGRRMPLPPVQTAHVWSMGPGRAEVSMVVAHRRNGALRPGGFDARQRHTIVCATAAPIPWQARPTRPGALRDSLGVPTGDGKSPCKVRVVVPRTPCIRL